ncbi:hypothetical protein ACJRO7_013442 [Eucalyptus globulus]|uniref:Uncharacterized protein n=1 Tax=Eucalyptus globulus TaxID=34317 RepID=A0ABD3KXY0_EUCGL
MVAAATAAARLPDSRFVSNEPLISLHSQPEWRLGFRIRGGIRSIGSFDSGGCSSGGDRLNPLSSFGEVEDLPLYRPVPGTASRMFRKGRVGDRTAEDGLRGSTWGPHRPARRDDGTSDG